MSSHLITFCQSDAIIGYQQIHKMITPQKRRKLDNGNNNDQESLVVVSLSDTDDDISEEVVRTKTNTLKDFPQNAKKEKVQEFEKDIKEALVLKNFIIDDLKKRNKKLSRKSKNVVDDKHDNVEDYVKQIDELKTTNKTMVDQLTKESEKVKENCFH